MKLSTFFIFLLIISGIFFVFAMMVKEANEQFPDESNLNSSEWENKYEFVENINQTISPLETKLKTIQDEDEGWFSKLTAGITAVPYVLLIVPQAVFGSIEFGGYILTDFFSVWMLPSFIATIALVMLLVWAIFKLVSFWNKTEV